jgi:hypothetical protein
MAAATVEVIQLKEVDEIGATVCDEQMLRQSHQGQ